MSRVVIWTMEHWMKGLRIMKNQSLWGWFLGLFVRGNKLQTLHDVNADELRRERIKIEQMESRFTQEIEELEVRKEAFFQKGVQCASDRQKLQFARKVKELDRQIRSRDNQLTLIARNLQAVIGLAQVKENDSLLKSLGVDGLLARMNLTEIQSFVEQATVEGQFQMEKFTTLLGALGEAEGVFEVEDNDADTRAIVAAMNLAAEGRTAEATEKAFASVNQELSPAHNQTRMAVGS